MGRKIVLLICFLSLFNLLSAQEGGKSVDQILIEAETAIDQERYEAARNILLAAKLEYPESGEIPYALGGLYYQKKLYALALEEYLRAVEITPEGYDELYALSDTYGKLNQNETSVEILEQMLELFPEDFDVVIDLSWMYSKVLRNRDSERLLLDKLQVWEEDKHLLMTLGTVYFGLYEYTAAKDCYMRSIRAAEAEGYSRFAAVAWNNLSLLELTFYHYNNALSCADSSLGQEERATAYLSRGDLNFFRLDYEAAMAEYSRAFMLDDTPLTKLSLAEVHLTFGNLEGAKQLLDEVRARDDDSWMHNFGIDIDRFNLWKEQLNRDLFDAFAHRESRRPGANPIDFIRKIVKTRYYAVQRWYHSRKYSRLCERVGLAYLRENNDLDADWSFYQGSLDYPGTALPYLLSARKFEVSIAPEAEAAYLLEEGRLTGDLGLVMQSLALSDPYWERRQIAEALIEAIPLLQQEGRSSSARDSAYRLYGLLPASFLLHEIRLPVAVSDDVPGSFKRSLEGAGFEVLRPGHIGPYDWRLDFSESRDGFIQVRLRDGSDILASVNTSFTRFSGREGADLIAEIQRALFLSHLEYSETGGTE